LSVYRQVKRKTLTYPECYIHRVCAWSLGCRHIVCFYNRRFLGCQVHIPALSRHRDNDARLLQKRLCFFFFFFFFRPPDLQNLSQNSAFCKELCVRNHAFERKVSHIPGFLPICIVFSSLTHLEFQFPIWSKKSITRPSCKHFLQCHFFNCM